MDLQHRRIRTGASGAIDARQQCPPALALVFDIVDPDVRARPRAQFGYERRGHRSLPHGDAKL